MPLATARTSGGGEEETPEEPVDLCGITDTGVRAASLADTGWGISDSTILWVGEGSGGLTGGVNPDEGANLTGTTLRLNDVYNGGGFAGQARQCLHTLPAVATPWDLYFDFLFGNVDTNRPFLGVFNFNLLTIQATTDVGESKFSIGNGPIVVTQYPFVAGATYRIHFQNAGGNVLHASVWVPDTGPEPDTFMANATTTHDLGTSLPFYWATSSDKYPVRSYIDLSNINLVGVNLCTH